MSWIEAGELRKLVDAPESEDLSTFVDDAYVILDELLSGSSLSDNRKALIQKYYAAHLWVLSRERGGLEGEVVGEAEQRYQKRSGQKGLRSTRFGEQALAFDTTGVLERFDSGSKTAQLRLA